MAANTTSRIFAPLPCLHIIFTLLPLPACSLFVLAGKTTVARVLARLLAMVGVLPCAKVVEVQRTDLVGEFVGHTGPKTRKKVRMFVSMKKFLVQMYKVNV